MKLRLLLIRISTIDLENAMEGTSLVNEKA